MRRKCTDKRVNVKIAHVFPFWHAGEVLFEYRAGEVFYLDLAGNFNSRRTKSRVVRPNTTEDR